jgi:hypothetical protein
VFLLSLSSWAVNRDSMNSRFVSASLVGSPSDCLQACAQGVERNRITVQLPRHASQKPCRSSSIHPGSAEKGTGDSRASLACVTPDITASKRVISVRPRRARDLECILIELPGVCMWLIFLEAGIALALLIFIVWWTMRGKR